MGNSGSVLVPLTPPYHPAPSFSDTIPRVHPPRSAAAQNVLLICLRVPSHAWNSSCAALAGTRTASVALQVSAVRVILGGFCLGSGYRAEPASGGRGFCLFRHSPNRERDFYLNPCTVEEMVFGGSAWGKGSSWLELFGSRGARCCVDFSDGGWNAARLFFSGVVSRREKCSVGTVV